MSEFWNRTVDFFSKNVISVLAEITFVDVLDILLLSLLLFSVFRFIKERRAGKLALGLAFVALVFVISEALRLRTMKYILENFYQVGLISLIVIFQSDLRAALEKVGNSPIRSIRKNFQESAYKNAEALTETLSRVCDTLSRSKTGALMVIERETKLGEYLDHCTIVNADPSEELLRNLFYNKAPLHDGAVVIREGRVYAAGCVLPLSSADVNRDLGTRHRAAIGVSEVSDAVVLVVSEETGTISIANNGKLTSNFNYTSLRQAILDYLVPEEMEKRRQKQQKKKKENKA